MIHLSSTAALVLLWTNGYIHRNTLASEFLKLMNPEPGKELHIKCNQIWPNYSEVIKNRKHCVLDLVQKEIKNDKNVQIVILGAGMDTLSLEILSQHRKIRIFEVDYLMDGKKLSLEKLIPIFWNLFL